MSGEGAGLSGHEGRLKLSNLAFGQHALIHKPLDGLLSRWQCSKASKQTIGTNLRNQPLLNREPNDLPELLCAVCHPLPHCLMDGVGVILRLGASAVNAVTDPCPTFAPAPVGKQ